MAEDIRNQLTEKISKLSTKPHLAVILVGSNEASAIYVKNKQKAALEMGMQCSLYHLKEDASQEQLLDLIKKLNQDKSVNGILVQMPLPKHIDEFEVIEAIDVKKDVDGFTTANAGLLHSGSRNAMIAATPKGILYLLEQTLGDIAGKHALIIGRSKIVGKPLMSLLLNNHCTVTITHTKTVDLPSLTKLADIIIVACGSPKMLKKDWVKKGVVVIDVGINRVDGKLCGDSDFDELVEVSSHITPVPGGVGPMTIAMLLDNTYQAFLAQNNK